jgi:hypothetical protein
MTRREAAGRFGLIVALAVGQAGCHDPDAGTFRAEPRAAGPTERVSPGPSARPSGPAPSRKPDKTNDFSPVRSGRGTQP